MPVFTLVTNVGQDKVSDGFVRELSQKIADVLHKPESYVAVNVKGGESVMFGGNASIPAGSAVLKSIGGVGGKANNAIAAALFPVIEKHLGIQGDRLYIEFFDLPAASIAYNGHTFG